MKKLKVCFILPNIFPIPAVRGGAVETLLQNLIDKNEKEKKLDITCVGIYDKEAEEQSKKYQHTKFIYIKDSIYGIPIKRKNNLLGKLFRALKIQYPLYVKEIYKKIANETYDNIIIEGGQLEQYRYLKNNIDTTFICHIHGSASINDTYSFYDYYFAPSHYVSLQLNKDNIVKNEQIQTLYNAVDTSKFNKKVKPTEMKRLKEKYHIQEEDTVFLFCGRTIKEKGIEELLRAFSNLKNIEKAKLLIVGNSNFGYSIQTPFDNTLKMLADRCPDKVIFTGFIDNNELYKIHAIADIAAVPSVWEEAFGLVVIEAMSSGTPIITTNSGAIPEIVNDNIAIILDKKNNFIENLTLAMDSLINDKKRLKTLKDAIIQYGNPYTVEKYYSDFVTLLKNLK